MKFSRLLTVVLVVVFFAGCQQSQDQGQQNDAGSSVLDTPKKDWALVIHGGAGVISKDMPDSIKEAYHQDLDEALTIGEDILQEGGSAVDAVEEVINYLEDNPKFNAGKGAVFTHEGGHELDAAIMIGNTRKAGTITGVKTVKNPISLARLVMGTSKHIMFAGEGAEKYADKMDVERVNQDYFYTERRYKSWRRAIKRGQEQSSVLEAEEERALFYDKDKFGTVGCVALDTEGQLVAGTSTGGMTNKMYGRVGDVPIIGSGTYASDVVAVSMTGWGERIMEAVSGHTVSAYMKHKPGSLKEAGNYLLREVLQPGDAGMIAVDKDGNMLMDMNTQGMFRGKSDSEGNREVAIWK
ncbi:isoaspartyl peptidase/L-asparaginase family protein [Fodinibius salsisoli]|uniref:Isoaspartyl peptidase/L-asparaginase n=1 Tax=Fodinibius salsisoli TaxID=2820877 RepID=A0ABT3PM09_9BACT|nr:isoaspartyl peptidase/L-asparaginase [Fodinibius salsisoli]MCW9706900.1 isoaspartyl peptidase/L-asparaginase [Fodinibius salsisoli]